MKRASIKEHPSSRFLNSAVKLAVMLAEAQLTNAPCVGFTEEEADAILSEIVSSYPQVCQVISARKEAAKK